MKRHRMDATSLVFGMIFLVVVGWWLGGRGIDVGLSAVGWALAVALIVFGGAGLVGALRGRSRHRDSGAEHDHRDAE